MKFTKTSATKVTTNKQAIGERGRCSQIDPAPQVIDVQCHQLRRRARPAASQRVGHVDHLEGFDEADQHHGGADRNDLRQDDVAEHLQAVGTIHQRGFDGFLRQALQERPAG